MEIEKITDNTFLLDLVMKKYSLAIELKNIENSLSIFRKEVAIIQNNIHVTKDGQVLYVPNMEDSHLLNTIRVVVKSRGIIGAEKYIDEAKRRGMYQHIFEIIKTVEIEYEDDGEMYPF